MALAWTAARTCHAWLATDLEGSRSEETRVFERCAAESPHGFDPPRHPR